MQTIADLTQRQLLAAIVVLGAAGIALGALGRWLGKPAIVGIWL